MPINNFKTQPEKKLEKVSIYLTPNEKELLMEAVGNQKLSIVLRKLVYDYVRRYKMSKP
jgi:hypothetical protein